MGHLETLNIQATLKRDGTLESWSLSNLGLTQIPESFAQLEVEDTLDLSDNDLVTLPESFKHVQVGKFLELHGNLVCENKPHMAFEKEMTGLEVNWEWYDDVMLVKISSDHVLRMIIEEPASMYRYFQAYRDNGERNTWILVVH